MNTEPSRGNARAEAARWFTRLRLDEGSDQDREAFAAWLAEDASHRLEFEAYARLWDELAVLKTLPASDLAAPRAFRGRRAMGRIGIGFGLAALLFLIVLGPPQWWGASTESYRTAKGERETIHLADGSRIDLNTDSEIQVTLGRRSRKVDLLRGEALFTVVHDAARPFEVAAGNGRVRDLGTRFDVYLRPQEVSVVVIEGRVAVTTAAVSDIPLSAGQQMAYTPNGTVSPVEAADLAAATSWLDGRLIFADRPLGEVIADMARYHDIDISVADPDLRRLKVNGTFKVHHLDRFLQSLESAFPIRVHRLGTRSVYLVRARR